MKLTFIFYVIIALIILALGLLKENKYFKHFNFYYVIFLLMVIFSPWAKTFLENL